MNSYLMNSTHCQRLTILNSAHIILRTEMGVFFSSHQPAQKQKPQIHDVDIVKAKLKKARDSLRNYIGMKNKCLEEVDKEIQLKLPACIQKDNKKILLPLLKTKKDLQTQIDNAQIRAKLISDKLGQLQIQQINSDTIEVLDSANQCIKGMQEEMNQKDWQAILEESKNKYEMIWPEQESMEEDEKFQELWKELGGDKVIAKAEKAPKVKLPQPKAQKIYVRQPKKEKQILMQ